MAKPINGVKCPECKFMIAADATICGHCQRQFTFDEIKKRKSQANAGWIGCLTAIGLFTLLVLSLTMCSSDPTPPGKPTATAKVDALQFADAIMSQGNACDVSFESAGRTMVRNDQIESYSAASAAAHVCSFVKDTIAGLPVPPSVGTDAADNFHVVQQFCVSLYEDKSNAMDAAAQVASGEGGIPEQARFQAAIEAMKGKKALCVGQLAAQLLAIGAKPEEIKRLGKPS